MLLDDLQLKRMDTLHSFLHGENHENSLKINRNLLGNNDQQTTSSSIYKHEKWFIMYGFTQAHSESDKINENEGITCSDNIKATYAKGVKANTCLSTTLKGHSGYIKITCHRQQATFTHFLDSSCNQVNPNIAIEEQKLVCQPSTSDIFASRGGTWLDDFDGESSTIRSILFACSGSLSDNERIPLPKTSYSISRYYSQSNCHSNDLIGFHAIRNHVCITTSSSSSTKYDFPKHIRYTPSRFCTGESFEADHSFSSNCTVFTMNEVLSNNGYRIGQVSFPFVSSALITGKTPIHTIMTASSGESLSENFIIISLLLAAAILILMVLFWYLRRKSHARLSYEDYAEVDTSLDISIRDNDINNE